jgi:hypothetical protein
MNVGINTEMTVNIGKGIDMAVPAFDTLTPEVRRYIVAIGWRNVLADSHASMTAEKANGGDVVAMSRDMAERKLAALVRGEVRATSTREGDPVRAEALRLITNAIKKKARDTAQKIEEKDVKAKARDFLNTPSAALDKIMVKAKKNVKEAADIDIEV